MSFLQPKKIKHTRNVKVCNNIIFSSAMFMVISCPVIHDGVILLKVRMGEYEQETGSVKTIAML